MMRFLNLMKPSQNSACFYQIDGLRSQSLQFFHVNRTLISSVQVLMAVLRVRRFSDKPLRLNRRFELTYAFTEICFITPLSIKHSEDETTAEETFFNLMSE